MYDWPVVMISNVQKPLFDCIKEKLTTNSLTLDDIKETQFGNLFFSFIEQEFNNEAIAIDGKILNDAFKSLQNIELDGNGEIFAIFSCYEGNPSFEFFADYESMATAFSNNYIGINTSWEELDDEDLEQWLNRLEDDFKGIPYNRFDSGEE